MPKHFEKNKTYDCPVVSFNAISSLSGTKDYV